MAKKPITTPRREDALSRERITEAAIALLDSSGEGGLTFRALSEHLATGPGAIYGHIASKSDLLTAACDAIVARTLDTTVSGSTPRSILRALALAMFDMLDDHPWVGLALNQSPGQLPVVRILERIGQQVCALGVPKRRQWTTASALLSYILGVGGQNAANRQFAQARDLDRSAFLRQVATEWSALDAHAYPFTRSMASHLDTHDDRADFLAGIDLILRGIEAS